MKQKLFKSWLLMMCLLFGVGQSWAESVVTTYTFNSKSWGATCNGAAANWTGSKDGNQYSASSSPIGVQILAAGNGTTVTSPKSFTNVSKVVVNYSSSSKGVGSIKVSVGGTDIDTKSISKSQSKVDLTYTPTTNLSGNVVITCNCTTNSYALVSVSITEGSGGSTSEPTKYNVTVANNIANGTVTADPTSAASGATVNLTATPATGYEFGTWNVTNASTSEAITVTDNKFTMPAANVNVSATFNQITPSRPANEIFYESFDDNDGTGGNDGQWSGNIASNTIQSDNENWDWNKASGANQCAKFGTGSALGWATTPAVGTACNATLTFKAAAWNGSSESTTLKLSVEGGGTISPATVTMTKGAWNTYTVTLTGLTADSKVKFEGNSSSNSRFFLDEVSIVKTGDATPEKTATSLSWSAATASVEYGATNPTLPTLTTDPADLTGVTYKSSNTGVATIDETTGAINIVAPGETTITASYAGNETYKAAQDASYTLTVTKVLDRITLSGEYKTVFTEGEAFTHEGLVVTAVYNDKSDEDVTSGATFSTPDMNSIGKQTVTVTYESKTAEYTITVNEAVKYTVTFDAQSGTCETASLKETASGAGVTLPSATIDVEGWAFAGWATAACEETTTAPTLYKAGDKYKPTADITLYAVYMTGAEECETAFNRVTSLDDVVPGKKMVVVSNKQDYALSLVAGTDVKVTDGNYASISDGKYIWEIVESTNGYNFKDYNVNTSGNLSQRTMAVSGIPSENATSVSVVGTTNSTRNKNEWTIAKSSIEGCFVISVKDADKDMTGALTVGTVSNKTQWGVLNVNGNSDASVFAMRIYVEGPTTNATYNSNPATPEYEEQHVDFVASTGTTVGTDRYYATFSKANDVFIPGEKITVYTVSVSGDQLTFKGLTKADNVEIGGKTYSGYYVPANNGVLMSTAYDGAYATATPWKTVSYFDVTGVNIDPLASDNKLRASSVTMETDGSYKFYKLAYDATKEENVLGFYYGATGGAAFTPRSGAAYLAVPSEPAAMIVGFRLPTDDTTGINAINNVEVKNDAVYNLNGQRISSNETFKGIVIVNGRKYLRK